MSEGKSCGLAVTSILCDSIPGLRPKEDFLSLPHGYILSYFITTSTTTLLGSLLFHNLVYIAMRKWLPDFANKAEYIQRHSSNFLARGCAFVLVIPINIWIVRGLLIDKDDFSLNNYSVMRGLALGYAITEIYDLTQRIPDVGAYIHHIMSVLYVLLSFEFIGNDLGLYVMALVGNLSRPIFMIVPLLYECKTPHQIRILVYSAIFIHFFAIIVSAITLTVYLAIYWDKMLVFFRCLHIVIFPAFLVVDIPYVTFFLKWLKKAQEMEEQEKSRDDFGMLPDLIPPSPSSELTILIDPVQLSPPHTPRVTAKASETC